MFKLYSTDNRYRAPNALEVAIFAREMERKWRLERELESRRQLADEERNRRAEARWFRFAQAVQRLKERIFSRPAAEPQPGLAEGHSAEGPC